MMGFYSCRETDNFFFKYISLLNIITDEKITNKAPNKVLEVGISFQIKYPNIIAKTSARYFKEKLNLLLNICKIVTTIN